MKQLTASNKPVTVSLNENDLIIFNKLREKGIKTIEVFRTGLRELEKKIEHVNIVNG